MIGYFVRHPVAANLLMVLVIVLGISVISGIERETFPAFASDSVNISVSYPGASAGDVDEEICAPIESALTGVTGLEELSCLSVEGRATATAELEENGDLIQFFNDVSSTVSSINDFPTDAETPSLEIANRSDLVALIAISGIAGKDGLVSYTDDLSDRLLAISGVASATVSGITDRELKVSFDQQALRRFGLSSSDLVSVIETTSFQQPLGSVTLAQGDLVVRYSGA
ncbi:MAG: efflux RND transporter permease subunit, partial [Roseibium sp.]